MSDPKDINISLLPDEILLQILQKLDSVHIMDLCMTNKKFFNLCKDKSLWKVVRIYGINIEAQILMQYISFMGPHTEEIYIIGSDHLQSRLYFDDIFLIKLRCPHLRVLHLNNIVMDALELYVPAFPKSLIELSFANCNLVNHRYVHRFLTGLDMYFTKLEALILSDCKWFITHTIMAISKLPRLKRLILNGCIQLRDFMPYLSLSTRYGFKHLEVVDLRRTYVSDSDVSCFNATKTLRELHLEYSEPPSNDFVFPTTPSAQPSRYTEPCPRPAIVEDLKNDIIKMEATIKETSLPVLKALMTNLNTIKNDLDEYETADELERIIRDVSNLKRIANLELETASSNDLLGKIDCGSKYKAQNREQVDGTPEAGTSKKRAFEDDEQRSEAKKMKVSNGEAASSSRESSSNSVHAVPTFRDNESNIFVERLQDLHGISRFRHQPPDMGRERNQVVVVISRNNARQISICFGENTRITTGLVSIGNRTVHSLFNSRAECKLLERISLNGYVTITDDSLVLLRETSHPLRSVDVRGTRVTQAGCTDFRLHRPECELLCDFEEL